jgi:prophage regulatory protein
VLILHGYKETQKMPEALHRIRQVLAACGLSRSELYRQINGGSFPRPLSLSQRAVAWRESDIQAWIAARVTKASPDKGGSND